MCIQMGKLINKSIIKHITNTHIHYCGVTITSATPTSTSNQHHNPSPTTSLQHATMTISAHTTSTRLLTQCSRTILSTKHVTQRRYLLNALGCHLTSSPPTTRSLWLGRPQRSCSKKPFWDLSSAPARGVQRSASSSTPQRDGDSKRYV